MKWVETNIVTPCRRERSISSSQKWSRASGSTPEVGSIQNLAFGALDHRDRQRQTLPDAEGQVRRALLGVRFETQALHHLATRHGIALGAKYGTVARAA